MEEKLIYRQMSKIMAEIGPIAKDQTASSKNFSYKFRGIDDIYNAIQSVLAKYEVFCLPFVQNVERHERPGQNGGALMFTLLTVDYTFYATDGSTVVARTTGEAMDTSDKSSNKAMSAAHKYLFIQSFCIGTTEPKDSENDNPEPSYKKPALPNEQVANEDWDNMLTIGEQYQWPRGYMNQWIREQRKTMTDVDIYQAGLLKFSIKNVAREASAV